MELRIEVAAPGRSPQTLLVTIDPAQPAKEMASALVTHLRLEERFASEGGLYHVRRASMLDLSRPLSESVLRMGDQIAITPFGGSPSRGHHGRGDDHADEVDLVVVGGPASGLRLPLREGEFRVGNFRYSNLLIDDPTLSRLHIAVTVAETGSVSVADADSSSGTFLEGRRLTAEMVPLEPGQILAAGASLLTISARARCSAIGPEPDPGSGQIAFNRPPRMLRGDLSLAFKIDRAPERGRGGGMLPLSSALIPIAMGGAMYLIYRQPAMLLFAAMAPVMAGGSFLESRWGRRRGFRKEAKSFRQRLDQQARLISQAWISERDALRERGPDAPTLLDRAETVDARLWERRPGNPDWLLLRVGWADIESRLRVEIPTEGDEALRKQAERMLSGNRTQFAMPMVVSLAEAGVVGLCGPAAVTGAVARWMAMQLATLHSPEDVVLAAVVPRGEQSQWSWMGWLPHVHSETSPLPGPLVVSDRDASSLLDRLLSLLEARRQTAGSFRSTLPPVTDTSVVIVIHGGVELPRGPVSTLLEQGPAVGIHVIWIAGDIHDLPGEARAVLDLRPTEDRVIPTLISPATGESETGLSVDQVSIDFALRVSRALAPVRDVTSRSAGAGVPTRARLLQILGLQDGDLETRLMEHWIRDRSSGGNRLLAAPIGLAAGNRVVTVGIRRDGPHGLVGGTTGSGKSELLQSLVAALATHHSPRTLNFMLVDYKGGAAFKDCVHLPHTVGLVTDLDGHLVNRALISLRAELIRRERILRDAGAKDLIDLEQRWPDQAPASLLIVVDEFAALATELPEFVDGMVDIAQRGRSLGIHLLLATQRPAGVINDRIRANTNLRLALRFNDRSDSEDVLETADAARPGLPPGRAFARTGPGEVTEFQTGYAGGRTQMTGGPIPVTVEELGFGGQREIRAQHVPQPDESDTDLVRLVKAITEVNDRLGIPPPPRPWLAPLPEVLTFDELTQRIDRTPQTTPESVIPFAWADDPQTQDQYEFGWDVEQGNLLLYGIGGSGTTTALASLALGLAGRWGPDRLHLYILDCGAGDLEPLRRLPHTGAFVRATEQERQLRLIRFLLSTINQRKAIRGPEREGLPTLVLLLDNFGGLSSSFESRLGVEIMEDLERVFSEGPEVRVHVVATGDRLGAVPIALFHVTRQKLLFRLSDANDYSVFGIGRQQVPRFTPGRALVAETGQVIQVALPSPDLGHAVGAVSAALPTNPTPPVPIEALPNWVPLPRLEGEARFDSESLFIPLGLGDRTLEPAGLTLFEGEHALVGGPARSGKSTVLCTVARIVKIAAPEMVLIGVALRRSPLRSCRDLDHLVTSHGDLLKAVDAHARADRICLLLIDDAETVDDPGAVILGLMGRPHLHVIAAGQADALRTTFGHWTQTVRRSRVGLLLKPNLDLDGDLLGAVLPRRQWIAANVGRGYLVNNGDVELVQTAGAPGAEVH